MVDADPDWTKIVGRVTKQAAPRSYTRVAIVAHSLGAVVSRRAILDGIECGATWPERSRLILFAPAHMGTRLLKDQSMLSGGLGGIVSTILVAWKLSRPAADDLKYGSPFLKKLWADTKRYLDEGWAEPLRAKQVLFGEHEIVVDVGRFCDDPIQQVWPNHTHVSICKVEEAATFVRDNLV